VFHKWCRDKVRVKSATVSPRAGETSHIVGREARELLSQPALLVYWFVLALARGKFSTVIRLACI